MTARLVALAALPLLIACSRAEGGGAPIGRDPAAPAPSALPTVSATVAPPPSVVVAPPPDGPAASPPAAPAQDADALREAVFRHMFGKNASGAQQTASVYCLHFEHGADPPASFLARFAGGKIPVVAGSACRQSANGVFHGASQKPGLAFRIDSVARADADHATVQGGYFEAGLSASGNVYTVERKNGAWVVTKDVMQWIS